MGRPAVSPVTTQGGISGKVCRGACAQWLPLTKFARHATCAGGRRNFCTTCEGRRAYASNPARVIKNVVKYQRLRPEETRARRRAANKRRYERKATGPGVTIAEYRELLVMYGHACAYCGGPSETIDHVTPLSRGGLHHIDNLVPACKKCNFAKHDKLLSEWKGD